MKKILFTFVLAIILTSCGGFEISRNVSESNPDIVTLSTPTMQVKSEHEMQAFFTEIQFFCFIEKGKRTYSLSASHITTQWSFFEKIIFTIDGVPIELIPDRPPTHDVYNLQGPKETITVVVPEQTVIDIYESIDTKMNVKGLDFQYDVIWNDDMKMNLYNFYKATLE